MFDRMYQIRRELSHTSSGQPYDPNSDQVSIWEQKPVEEKKEDIKLIRDKVKSLHHEADNYEHLAAILEKLYEANLAKLKLEAKP